MSESLKRITAAPVCGRAAIAFVRAVVRECEGQQLAQTVEIDPNSVDHLRDLLVGKANSIKVQETRQWAKTLATVIVDLHQQGWKIQYKANHLWGERPAAETTRESLRSRFEARRRQQLSEPSVGKFIKNMEQARIFRGRPVSIYSLLRDGRDLLQSIAVAPGVDAVMQPYLEFVTAKATCEHTGFRLQDIWRYMRHTWANPYESIPGRSLQIIVRDAAAAFHPVIGIAALSSAAIRLGPRDRFIGWDTDDAVAKFRTMPIEVIHRWAGRVLEQAISELYCIDFIRDGVIPMQREMWDNSHIDALKAIAQESRASHHRLMDGQDYKQEGGKPIDETDWERTAELPLFRSKRAGELAALIELQLSLFAKGTTTFESVSPSIELDEVTLSRLVKIARSKTVGTEIADLTVCGAIAPYSHLAAGKLVALLATSPAAVAEYSSRYGNSPGIISSSMAGRPIKRRANLCFVGTTSLYGKRPNQYDRISMPASVVGGAPDNTIRFQNISDSGAIRTRGIGTFQFSSATLRSLEAYAMAQKGGWRVNNVFGEGTSPKLRALREGLDGLGLNTDELLIHGIEKCMYGMRLASNVPEYLLGFDAEPRWLFDRTAKDVSTIAISNWWANRWALSRLTKSEVIEMIRRETLVHPIRHSGRVQTPASESNQQPLFD